MKKSWIFWTVGLAMNLAVNGSDDFMDDDFVMIPRNVIVEMYQNGSNVTCAQEPFLSGMVDKHLALEMAQEPVENCLEDYQLHSRLVVTMNPFLEGGLACFGKEFSLYDMGSQPRSCDDIVAGILVVSLCVEFGRHEDRFEVIKTYPYQ